MKRKIALDCANKVGLIANQKGCNSQENEEELKIAVAVAFNIGRKIKAGWG